MRLKWHAILARARPCTVCGIILAVVTVDPAQSFRLVMVGSGVEAAKITNFAFFVAIFNKSVSRTCNWRSSYLMCVQSVYGVLTSRCGVIGLSELNSSLPWRFLRYSNKGSLSIACGTLRFCRQTAHRHRQYFQIDAQWRNQYKISHIRAN